MNAGQSAGAISVANEIGRLKPGSPESADAYENSEQYSTALPLRLKLVEANPSDQSALFGLANNYRMSGQRDLAVPLANKIIQIDPNTPWAQYARDILKG